MQVEATPENLEAFLEEMRRELTGWDCDTEAVQLALTRLKQEINPYADLAEMVFFDVVDSEVVIQRVNYTKLVGARIAYRSRVGFTLGSPKYGKFSEAELRKEARIALKHARITFEQKSRKPATV